MTEHREADFFDRKLAALEKEISLEGRDDLGYPIIFQPERVDFLDPSLRFALRLMGDVRGRRILDCGCGSGLASVYLAKQGAQVFAFDVSGEAVRVTQKRAVLNGVSDRLSVSRASLHLLPYPDRFFDGIFGSFILHHVDLPAASREIARVLKGGREACFVENSSRNPLLMFARRHLVGRFGIPKKGSPDEHPLTGEETAFLKSQFDATLHYADFVFFRMVDYLIPFRIFRHLGFWLDRGIYHLIPWARSYSYYLVCQLRVKE